MSREQVDNLVAKAVAAGGWIYDKPENHGFIYTHSFVNSDGHGEEMLWLLSAWTTSASW